jgi:hypothetical protein
MSWATLNAAANRVAFDRLGSVSVTAGAVSGQGFLKQNSEMLLGDQVVSVDYALTCEVVLFGGLSYGSNIIVDNVNYQVRHEPMRLDDGTFCVVPLAKLAPDVTASGGRLRTMALDDLSDVALVNPVAGEALKYDGTNWTDDTVASAPRLRRHDFASPYDYCGTAPAGSAESAAVWTITRITVASNGTTITGAATGVSWAGRASATYS